MFYFLLIRHGTQIYFIWKMCGTNICSTLWDWLCLCLTMGSDRIIAKEEKSLVVLSLNWYVMTQVGHVSHFYQRQYFILRHFLGRKLVDLKKHQNFLQFGI